MDEQRLQQPLQEVERVTHAGEAGGKKHKRSRQRFCRYKAAAHHLAQKPRRDIQGQVHIEMERAALKEKTRELR